jgi:hypothetical protein
VITRNEVLDWLRSEKVALTDDTFEASWRCIVATRLIDLQNEGASFSQQRGGYFAMLLAGNREKYFQQALSAVVSASA